MAATAPSLRESNGAFVLCWTLAVVAASAAFCVHLTVRVRAIELGYEMGRIHSQLTRLREVRRVLELEVASYETPERVDLVARTLLGMSPPGADRVLHAAALPKVLDAEREAVRSSSAKNGSPESAGGDPATKQNDPAARQSDPAARQNDPAARQNVPGGVPVARTSSVPPPPPTPAAVASASGDAARTGEGLTRP